MAQIPQTSQVHRPGRQHFVSKCEKNSFPDDELGRQLFVSENVKKSCLCQMMSLSYEEMLDLTEEKLEKMGVTKVRYCLAKK